MGKVMIEVVVILVVAGMVVTGYAVRSYMFWKTSVNNLIDARNALDDNLVLLEAGLAWERKSGYAEAWISRRIARIAELKEELEQMASLIKERESASFGDRMVFGEGWTRTARGLNTYWALKRRESIVGLVEFLRECQSQMGKKKPYE